MSINKLITAIPVCNSCEHFKENHPKQIKGVCDYWKTVVKRLTPICICVNFKKPENNEQENTPD